MKINEANVCYAKDKVSGIVSISDDNKLKSLFAKEFLINTPNPALLNVRGGDVRIPIKKKTCTGFGKDIAGANFFTFYKRYDDVNTSPYSAIRKKLLPFDPTPLNSLSIEAGIASMKEFDLSFLNNETPLGEKNRISLKDIFLFLEETDFSYYPFIRLDKEKTALFYNRNTNKFEIKINKKANVEKAVFSIYEFNNGYKFKTKKMYSKATSFYTPDTIEEFPLSSMKSSIANTDQWSHYVVDEVMDLYFTSKYVGSVYINKTPYYQRVITSKGTNIVYPYGIKILDKDEEIAFVNNYYDLIAEITSIDIENNESLYGDIGKITDIGGYHIFGDKAILDMDDDFITANKYYITNQVGPLLIPGVMDNHSNMVPQTVYKDKDNRCVVFKSSIYDKTFNIRFENKILYVKLSDEVEYSIADVEDGKYVYNTGDDKYVLGEMPYTIIHNDIERHPGLLYEVDYTKRDDKLYRVLGYAYVVGGYHFYQRNNGVICSDWSNYKNNLSINPCDISSISELIPNKSISAHSDKDNRAKHIDHSVDEVPGLKVKEDSEDRFYLIGFDYFEKVIDDTNPLNKFTRISNPSEYSGEQKVSVLYWTIDYNGKLYDIAYISPTDNTLYRDTFANCKCQKPKHYFPISDSNNNSTVIEFFIREHKDIWDDSWEQVTVSPTHYTPAIQDGLNLGGVVPMTTQLLGDIHSTFFIELYDSSVTEYLFDNTGFSLIEGKYYINIKELGVLLLLDDLSILDTPKIEIIKDTNKRGVSYTNGKLKVEFTITMDEEGRKINYYIDIDGNSVSVSEDALCLMLKAVDGNGKLIEYDKLKPIKKRPEIDNGYLIPEIAINYMFKQGVRQLIVGFVDESDVMADDSKFTITLDSAEEGSLLHVMYDGNETEFVGYEAALNALQYDRPYMFYGEPFAAVEGRFHLLGTEPSYDTEKEFFEDLSMIMFGCANRVIYTTPITGSQKPFTNFRFNIDSKIIGLTGSITTEVPRRNKVELNVELGLGNKLQSNLPLIQRDFIYKMINGYCYANYTDNNGNEVVKYLYSLTNTMLDRHITINPKEQTSIAYNYYTNAKTQLIQDLREDTVPKRIEGSGILVKYDMQRVYKSIHTIEDYVWNVPTAFVCDDTEEETVLNKIRVFNDAIYGEIRHKDVALSQNKTIVFINNSSDEDKELTISVDNTYFFNSNTGYNFKNLFEMFANKKLLNNWFADIDFNLDENFLTKGKI